MLSLNLLARAERLLARDLMGLLPQAFHRKRAPFLVGIIRGGYCPGPENMADSPYKVMTKAARAERIEGIAA